MSQRRRFLPRACVMLVSAALILTPARRARADSIDSLFAGIFAALIIGTVSLGTDTVFTVHDAAVATTAPPADRGWSITETILVVPQSVLFNGILVAHSASTRKADIEDEGITAFFVGASAWSSALATRGIWGTASPWSDPGVLYGGSWAVGINTALTMGALGAAFGKHFPGRTFGVMEMVGTTPSLAVSIYELSAPGHPYKGAYGALAGWSGALFVHGVVSLAVGIKEPREEQEKETKAAYRGWRRAPRLRWTLAPMMLGGGPAPAQGVVVGGVF